MCVRCLAALRSLDDCPETADGSASRALGGGTQSSSDTVVSDYRSILYHLDGGPNFRWNAQQDFGDAVVVTYSFGSGGDLPSLYGSSNNPFGASGFSAFTASQRQNFRIAAAEFMAASGLVLVEVDTGGDINVFNAHGTPVGGYADLPYVAGSYQSEVQLVIDSTGDYAPGSYGYFTMLHELGHALGLDHTHEGAYTLQAGMDSTANSVMSYNYDRSTLGLQALDVSALQSIYGAPVASGNWSFAKNTARDRLEAQGSSGSDSLAVPLSVNGQDGKSKIFGGAGQDDLTGAGAADILRGNQGDDSLIGAGGADKLRGGSGDDTLMGGQGDDFLHGGSGDDLVQGDMGSDSLIGGAGDDTLRGGMGNDSLTGRLGADELTGGGGADVFIFAAGSGRDRITDFELDLDIIRIEMPGVQYAGLTISDVSGGAQISGPDLMLTLDGISASDLSADQFVFV